MIDIDDIDTDNTAIEIARAHYAHDAGRGSRPSAGGPARYRDYTWTVTRDLNLRYPGWSHTSPTWRASFESEVAALVTEYYDAMVKDAVDAVAIEPAPAPVKPKRGGKAYHDYKAIQVAGECIARAHVYRDIVSGRLGHGGPARWFYGESSLWDDCDNIGHTAEIPDLVSMLEEHPGTEEWLRSVVVSEYDRIVAGE